MSRPVIGLTIDASVQTGRYSSHFSYAASIEAGGGLPLLLPYRVDHALIGEFLDRLDGLLLSGGDDLDPALYGEQWHLQVERIDSARQAFDLTMLAEAERRRLPVLGICLGCQMMNVHRGGSLHQFLPDVPRDGAIEHRKADRDDPRHMVAVHPDSLLARTVGGCEISANTFHKQAIRRVGRNLRVTAVAPDGIVEGIEDPTMPLFLGVQWHPERLADERPHLALFQLLVAQANARRETNQLRIA